MTFHSYGFLDSLSFSFDGCNCDLDDEPLYINSEEETTMLLNLEDPSLKPVKNVLQKSLEEHKLDKKFNPNKILVNITEHQEEWSKPGTLNEIQIAWLKTTGLAEIKKIDRKRAVSRRNFIRSVKPLFENGNSIAYRFCASVAHRLRQFRLSQTYEVREIITDGIILGIDLIDSGEPIGIPLAWLRKTCFNLIWELRREQDRIENPRLDPTAYEPGDAVLSEMQSQEDWEAMHQALEKLSAEDQQLLLNKILEDLTWQQVSDLLSASNESSVSHGTVRQRGSRAKQRLRQHYEAIREVVKLSDDVAPTDLQPDMESAQENSELGGD